MKQGRTRRLLYRDISNLSNNSMEGGGGGGGVGGGGGGEYHAQSPASVPFIWESSPGTPKRHVNINNKVRNNIEGHDPEFLPPLTPPPSYQYNNTIINRPSISKKKKQNDGNTKNSNLIQTVFPRLSLKRDHPPSLSSSPSTKSTSPSPSSSTSPLSSLERRRLSFDSRAEIEAEMFTYNGYKSYVVRSSPSRQSKRPEEEEDEVVDGGDSPVSTLCFRRFTCCNVKLRGLYSTWF
ncbi:unnamed protein product [Amaranthus hypochondriacus]